MHNGVCVKIKILQKMTGRFSGSPWGETGKEIANPTPKKKKRKMQYNKHYTRH